MPNMWSKNMNEEYELEYLGETELSIHVFDGDNECWLQKSMIVYDDLEYKVGELVAIEIPQWLAVDKNLA